jgi:hypothetical protein
MSFNIRSDTFTNKDNTGPIEVPSGLSVDVGELAANGKLNIAGITTVGFLTAQHVTVGVITATTLIGEGSGLINLPTVTTSKSIALKLILSDPPLRS